MRKQLQIKLRADNTFLIEGRYGDNPKLMGRLRSDGRITLYLEHYMGKSMAVSSRSHANYRRSLRRNEPLGIFLYDKPGTTAQRRHNRDTLLLAREMRHRSDRSLSIVADATAAGRPTDLLQWMDSYCKNYTLQDYRHIARSFRIFREYLAEAKHTTSLTSAEMTPALITGFTGYVSQRFRGEGPHTLYARFKKIIKSAVQEKILPVNPCQGIVIKIDVNTLKKEVLSDNEISLLTTTHYPDENTEVRRAFLFCLYAGLRWCDVTRLNYTDVDSANSILRFEQAKTRGHSNASAVVIPLSSTLKALIGPIRSGDRVFQLPSRRTTQKELTRWTKAAGITKHITWHCARHSFALRLLNHGANIKTVASLLGHSTIRHTEKYIRALDPLRRAAILSLPPLPASDYQ